MTSAQSGLIVDADGHVLEPADTWLTYIDPQYRDRAIRIASDEQGARRKRRAVLWTCCLTVGEGRGERSCLT
jgi:hypothetical protein